MWHIRVIVPEDSLGDIAPAYYAEMLAALVEEHFGPASFVCTFASAANNCWSVDCPADARDFAVSELNQLADGAFARCCRHEQVPVV